MSSSSFRIRQHLENEMWHGHCELCNVHRTDPHSLEISSLSLEGKSLQTLKTAIQLKRTLDSQFIIRETVTTPCPKHSHSFPFHIGNTAFDHWRWTSGSTIRRLIEELEEEEAEKKKRRVVVPHKDLTCAFCRVRDGNPANCSDPDFHWKICDQCCDLHSGCPDCNRNNTRRFDFSLDDF